MTVDNMDLTGYDRWSVADIGKLISKAIQHYQDVVNDEDNPHYVVDARDYAFRQAMRLGKGVFNPATIESMVNMERSIWRPGTIAEC